MMPRSLQEILAQADDLADAFEAYEPADSDEGKASSLVELRLAVSRRAQADRAIVEAVADAREHNVTWAAIGEQLGTSGEAARQRYGQLVEH